MVTMGLRVSRRSHGTCRCVASFSPDGGVMLMLLRYGSHLESYGTSAVPVQRVRAEFLGGGDVSTTHAKAYPRE